MARKELSPYAPDVWIRQLNRTYPNLWTDLRKVYAEPEKILNSKSGGVSLIAEDVCRAGENPEQQIGRYQPD